MVWNPLKGPLIAAVVGVILCGAALASVYRAFPPAATQLDLTIPEVNVAGSELPMVHRLDRYEGGALLAGKLTNLSAIDSDGEPRLALAGVIERVYPVVGEWLSDEVKTEFNFTELLPSWNIITPPTTGARFDVRTKDARTGQWSPWLYMGQWGDVPDRLGSRTESVKNLSFHASFGSGRVAVDILYLTSPASHYQVRARLVSRDPTAAVSPQLRRVSVCYSAAVGDRNQRDLLTPAPQQRYYARDLPVPFRAQCTELDNIRSDICSPTSVAMLMEFSGVNKPTGEVALTVWDGETDLFGNWNRAVAMAGSVGLDAYLTRIASIDDARAYIARGQPLIASIQFSEGEFPSNVMKATDGHLIVIRGFTHKGDAIVNDPASQDKGHAVVYNAAELELAWVKNAGGIAYVIAPRGKLGAEN